MGMQIDQSRREDGARQIADLSGGIGLQSRSDACHLSPRERHVRYGIDLLGWIDQTGSAQDEIV